MDSHRAAQTGLQELQAESPAAQLLVTFELLQELMSQRHWHVQVILPAAIPPVAAPEFAVDNRPPVAAPPEPPTSDTDGWVAPPEAAALAPSDVAPVPPVEPELPPPSSSPDELHAKPTRQTRQHRCELN